MNSVLINAANTVAILDLEFKEAIVAPGFTPRVLNLPVVGVALCIHCTFVFTFYPPVVDLTFSDWCISVAHDNNAVVDAIRIALFHSAAAVESELSRRGI